MKAIKIPYHYAGSGTVTLQQADIQDTIDDHGLTPTSTDAEIRAAILACVGEVAHDQSPATVTSHAVDSQLLAAVRAVITARGDTDE
jgi:hypothetical protein